MRVGSWIVVVIWCFWCGILERGVDPRGVDLGSVSFLEVLTSLHISAYLECCFAALLKPSIAKVKIYPA
jgi:hypothetical protein